MAAKRLLDATDVPFFIASFFPRTSHPASPCSLSSNRCACFQKTYFVCRHIFSPVFLSLRNARRRSGDGCKGESCAVLKTDDGLFFYKQKLQGRLCFWGKQKHRIGNFRRSSVFLQRRQRNAEPLSFISADSISHRARFSHAF